MTAEAFDASRIDAAAVQAAIADLPRFHAVRCYDVVDSTNAQALALADDRANLGLSLIAEQQSAGRGRGGRSWTSPRGAGLLISTIMPAELPVSTLPALGYWISLCAADAIIESCSVWTTLKWPNDLMLGAGKAAGVLIEGRTTGEFTRAVAGIGINANRPPQTPAELDGVAAWLSDVSGAAIDRTALAIALLRSYARRFDDLLARPVQIIREWSRRSAIAGRRLRVHALDGSLLHEGTGTGLSDDGALLLETQDGPTAVRLGDVS